MAEVPELLQRLLSTPSPSGYEAPAATVWREAASFAELATDKLGSSIARVGDADAGPLVAVVGHIDEIGLAITHVDEKGFAYFTPIGGWDPQILVGQRPRLHRRPTDRTHRRARHRARRPRQGGARPNRPR